MTVVERVASRIIESDVALLEPDVRAAAQSLLGDEAPLSPPGVVQAVVDEVLGLGPLEPLLRDPLVSDVLVSRWDTVFVEREGRVEPVPTRFRSERHLRAGIERVLAPLGLRLDHGSPIVDARLADGSRLHATIPPIAVDGTTAAIRRFNDAVPSLDALATGGHVSEAGAELLREAVRSRLTILVSGGTGAGKTTLLNLLSREIPRGERIVTIEDAAELRLSGDVVRLEARSPNREGVGAITIRDLIRAALRLRPDRIVVGEVRGSEAYDLVGALNTGHDGSMSTVHANSPEEALIRLEMLALGTGEGIDGHVLRAQLRRAIDLVVQLGRVGRLRTVTSIAAMHPDRTETVYGA
ncbi:MAG: CpaF family protein [Acidimicrobiia bacterium]|nr:MAG: CpaF family protein [Acidimicrobiia bacterium]